VVIPSRNTLFSCHLHDAPRDAAAVGPFGPPDSPGPRTPLQRAGGLTPDLLPAGLAALVLVDDSGCWLWAGRRNAKGYGPHRRAYEHIVGEVPGGLQLDHVCRVRWCINPEHLEPVTAQENVLRSPVVTPAEACRRGLHPWPEYVYVRPSGERECRGCRADRVAEYHARRRKAS
jgi:hypothetical protein